MSEFTITGHALYRYIERCFDFDWSGIRAEAAKALKKRDVSDAEVVSYADKNIDLSAFKASMQAEIVAAGSANLSFIRGVWPVVVENGKVITVLDRPGRYEKKPMSKNRRRPRFQTRSWDSAD